MANKKTITPSGKGKAPTRRKAPQKAAPKRLRESELALPELAWAEDHIKDDTMSVIGEVITRRKYW